MIIVIYEKLHKNMQLETILLRLVSRKMIIISFLKLYNCFKKWLGQYTTRVNKT